MTGAHEKSGSCWILFQLGARACTCLVSVVLKKPIQNGVARQEEFGASFFHGAVLPNYKCTLWASSCTLPCCRPTSMDTHWTCRLASHRGKRSYGSFVQIMNSYGSRYIIMQRFFCIMHLYHTVLSAWSYHFTALFVLSLMATGKFPDCSLFFLLEMIHNIWL